MRKFLNWFSVGFAAFFFIPTFLILISWNAVPGDRLYKLKIALEDVALAITLRTPLASNLSIGYTERRFDEANILLSKEGSTIGYELLVKEADESKDILIDKNDTKQAVELVTKIEEYQRDIGEKQESLKEGSLTIPEKSYPSEVPSVTQEPPSTPSYQKPTSSPRPRTPRTIEPAKNTEVAIQDLEEAKNELEKVKEEIKNKLPDRASQKAREAIDKKEETKEKPANENSNKSKEN